MITLALPTWLFYFCLFSLWIDIFVNIYTLWLRHIMLKKIEALKEKVDEKV